MSQWVKYLMYFCVPPALKWNVEKRQINFFWFNFSEIITIPGLFQLQSFTQDLNSTKIILISRELIWEHPIYSNRNHHLTSIICTKISPKSHDQFIKNSIAVQPKSIACEYLFRNSIEIVFWRCWGWLLQLIWWYFLSNVCLRLSQVSQFSFMQYIMELCVFILPFYLVMIVRIRVLYLIIIKSEVWPTCHCIGLGHETMVYAICLYMVLKKYGSE